MDVLLHELTPELQYNVWTGGDIPNFASIQLEVEYSNQRKVRHRQYNVPMVWSFYCTTP